MSFSHRSGFTLIELGIVLIIIGLITGGILVGQDLIKASQLRQILSNVETFNTAVHAFDAKYNALPGDMSNATSVWPAKSKCPSPGDLLGLDSSTDRVCNGDGNGMIRSFGSSGRPEPWGFWQQLALAGLINGAYTGLSNDGGDQEIAGGSNSPRGPFNGIYSLQYHGTMNPGCCNDFFPGTYRHTYRFSRGSLYGGYNLSGNYTVHILTPQEQFSLDSKVDDGKPGTGKIISFGHNGGFGLGVNCVTNLNPATSVYKSTTAIGCTPIFIQQF